MGMSDVYGPTDEGESIATMALAELERAVPPGSAAGDRYPAPQMVHLDSERAQGTARP